MFVFFFSLLSAVVRIVWNFINFTFMILRITALTSLLVLGACTISDTIIVPDKTNTGSSLNTWVVLSGTLIPTETGTSDTQDPLVEDLSGSGSAYYPIFAWLETRAIRVKHIAGVETKISFINSLATSMRVTIDFPGSATGNLRLAQIVMPDANIDWPFGTDFTVDLAQKGGYELRFRENMMSGDPWSGEAIITITLLSK